MPEILPSIMQDYAAGTLVKTTDSDPLAIYAKLLGRSGGQTLIGGTAASNNLILKSTSHSTKGYVQFGDAAQATVYFGTAGWWFGGATLKYGSGNNSRIEHDGAHMYLRSYDSGNQLYALCDAASACGLTIRGASSQTGNLTEWQNSSFSILSKVNAAGNVGVRMGSTALTALLHIAAGTTAASTAPLKLTSGTNMTTAEAGAFEYDGTNLFFTRSGTTRETTLCGTSGATAPSTSVGVAISNYYGSAATNFLGDPNSWASVNIAGTTYKIPLYT